MRAKLFIFLCLCMFALEADTFSEFSEMNQKAEIAMARREWNRARTIFCEMRRKGVAQYLSQSQYSLLTVRLAKAEYELRNYDAVIALLDPIERTVATTALLARALSDSGEAEKALGELLNLDKVTPSEEWPREDRAYFTALKLAIDDHFNELLRQADRAMDGTCYEEAAFLLQRVLSAISRGTFPMRGEISMTTKVHFRLAEALFQLNRFDEVTTLLVPIRTEAIHSGRLPPDSIGHRALYLLGLAQKRSGQIEQALATFLTALDLTKEPSHTGHLILWESATCFYEMGDHDQAEALFTRLTGSSLNSRALSASKCNICQFACFCKCGGAIKRALSEVGVTRSAPF